MSPFWMQKNSLVPIQKDKTNSPLTPTFVVSSHLNFSNGIYKWLSLAQKPEYIICKTRKQMLSLSHVVDYQLF